MAPDPIDLTVDSPTTTHWCALPSYQPILAQPSCAFPPAIFQRVVLNILKKPNITSSHLFRADILYDSDSSRAGPGGGADDVHPGSEAEAPLAQSDVWPADAAPGLTCTRSLVRRLVPRNVQLDRELLQSCHVLEGVEDGGRAGGRRQTTVVQCIPHVRAAEEVPWYHPCVQGLLYVYSWTAAAAEAEADADGQGGGGTGELSVHYRLFAGESLPLPTRLQRTAFHLLSTMYKHGQGQLKGYVKKFHHDLLVPQSRVQDTYSALKLRHAKRLCDQWVETTEPSKHVFEDLAIAAFLVEFWRDMYRDPSGVDKSLPKPPEGNSKLPEFPGFVDIGCGNGVLTEVLTCCGYEGWGFDARRRKTWSILSPETKKRLEERILVPQPLLSDKPVLLHERRTVSTNAGDESPSRSYFQTALRSVFSPAATVAEKMTNDQDKWHNGLFPKGTFIVSNHADELTAWTPLLASLSSSPFLAIPCCSHNLAGTRFRAPSVYTNFTADAAAPNYFAKEKKTVGKVKHIAIHIPLSDGTEVREDFDDSNKKEEPETGDLKKLSVASRAKQPSAYSSLCDWVAALADEIGFDVEKEMLRIPSTRNIAIIGRRWQGGEALARRQDGGEGDDDRRIPANAWDAVMQILVREKPDSQAWVERARKLMSGKDDCRVNHG